MIIGIDNRAIEMARDIKLDVTERGNLEEIAFFIDNNSPSLITIPNKEIEKWKHQFNVDGSKVK